MKREEIINKIVYAIKTKIGESYKIHCIENVKNNNLILHEVVITKPGTKVSPCIPINELINAIENGNIKVQDAAQIVINMYRNLDIETFADISGLFNKDEILKRVVCQVIGTEKNKKMLEELPHKELLDLSVVYRVIIDDNVKLSSFLINKKICDYHDISEEELDAAATFNTAKNGFCVMKIEEKIKELEDITIENECSGLFVLTNNSNMYGAAVLLYKSYFNTLAHELESDLYVLPSSIHEVLAIPAEKTMLEYLKTSVSEINANCVAQDEILTESVYRYSLETECFSIEGSTE